MLKDAKEPKTKKAPAPVKRRATFGMWVAAARPSTLVIALASVLMAWAAASVSILARSLPGYIYLLAFLLAVFLQIGANYINDYADGLRGVDAHRGHKSSTAPRRLTASGLVRPLKVLITGAVFLLLAALCGIAVVVLRQEWWLIIVGAVSILAAIFYTLGPKPYGYMALGELAVFIFFGPVAVIGGAYLFTGYIGQLAIFTSLAAGFLAVSVLIINNLRDRELDQIAKKKTLAVLGGKVLNRVLCVVCLALPYLLVITFGPVFPTLWYAFLTLLVSLPAMLISATAASPREFLIAFRVTLWYIASFAVFVFIGFYF